MHRIIQKYFTNRPVNICNQCLLDVMQHAAHENPETSSRFLLFDITNDVDSNFTLDHVS